MLARSLGPGDDPAPAVASTPACAGVGHLFIQVIQELFYRSVISMPAARPWDVQLYVEFVVALEPNRSFRARGLCRW